MKTWNVFFLNRHILYISRPVAQVTQVGQCACAKQPATHTHSTRKRTPKPHKCTHTRTCTPHTHTQEHTRPRWRKHFNTKAALHTAHTCRPSGSHTHTPHARTHARTHTHIHTHMHALTQTFQDKGSSAQDTIYTHTTRTHTLAGWKTTARSIPHPAMSCFIDTPPPPTSTSNGRSFIFSYKKR